MRSTTKGKYQPDDFIRTLRAEPGLVSPTFAGPRLNGAAPARCTDDSENSDDDFEDEEDEVLSPHAHRGHQTPPRVVMQPGVRPAAASARSPGSKDEVAWGRGRNC